MVDHVNALLEKATVVPAVNQIECHAYFAQQPVQDLAAEHGILTQAWSPIGGITFYRDGNHGSTLDDPTIGDVASAHGRTAAQVMLRWGLQHGRSVIPKSTKPSRIAENIDLFDFELSDEQMTAIDRLDTGHRGGPEPSRRSAARSPKPETRRPLWNTARSDAPASAFQSCASAR